MNNNFNYVPQKNQFSSYFNQMNTSTNNIVWVQGIEGAKAWQLSPNSMIILLDSEVEGKMYIKVSDNIGMSSLRVFNYTEEIPQQQSIPSDVTINQSLDLSQYVKKDELIQLVKEVLNEQPVSTTGGNEVNGATDPATAKPKIIYTTTKKQ